jgi:hypothetical protein
LNKVGKIDPACRPPRSQRIPHKPGKVVVQMVVYLPSPLTQKPVLASFLQGRSEDTLSVSGSRTEILHGAADVLELQQQVQGIGG